MAPENYRYLAALIQIFGWAFEHQLFRSWRPGRIIKDIVVGESGSQSELSGIGPVYFWGCRLLPLRTEYQLLPERNLVFEDIIGANSQFVGHNAHGDELSGLGSSSGQMGLPEFSDAAVISDDLYRCLGERPFEVGVTLFGTPASFADIAGLSDAGHHPGGGAEVFWALKATDVAHLIKDREGQDLADAGNRLKQIK